MLGFLTALPETELLVVEPVRKVREADAVRTPVTLVESHGDDTTDIVAILSLISVFFYDFPKLEAFEARFSAYTLSSVRTTGIWELVGRCFIE